MVSYQAMQAMKNMIDDITTLEFISIRRTKTFVQIGVCTYRDLSLLRHKINGNNGFVNDIERVYNKLTVQGTSV